MQGFLFTGLGLTTAITASIVFSIWPIVAIILAALLLGERFTPWQAAGVILCFGGVLVIVARGNVDRIVDLDINAGDFWILGAVAGMAIYTILLKRVKIDLHAAAADPAARGRRALLCTVLCLGNLS